MFVTICTNDTSDHWTSIAKSFTRQKLGKISSQLESGFSSIAMYKIAIFSFAPKQMIFEQHFLECPHQESWLDLFWAWEPWRTSLEWNRLNILGQIPFLGSRHWFLVGNIEDMVNNDLYLSKWWYNRMWLYRMDYSLLLSYYMYHRTTYSQKEKFPQITRP